MSCRKYYILFYSPEKINLLHVSTNNLNDIINFQKQNIKNL